jgi:hypothetical protein
MPIDTNKQASMYVKGHIANIWERDSVTGEPVVPYKKKGEQFRVSQVINLSSPRPGQTLTMEQLDALINNPTVDVSIVESPRVNK